MSARIEHLVAELRDYALALPEAWLDHPWGEDVAKVRAKVFVFFGTGSKPGSTPGFSVKLPEAGEEARLLPFCEPTGYGLGKSGWVTVKLRASELGMRARFEAWILESYRAVAPKTLAKQLDGGAPGPVASTREPPREEPSREKAASNEPTGEPRSPRHGS